MIIKYVIRTQQDELILQSLRELNLHRFKSYSSIDRVDRSIKVEFDFVSYLAFESALKVIKCILPGALTEVSWVEPDMTQAYILSGVSK